MQHNRRQPQHRNPAAVYQTWLAVLAAMTCIRLGWRYCVGQLERARAAQQAFSKQVIDSQENERKLIPAELHDNLGQRLVVIKNWLLLLLQARGRARSARLPAGTS